LTDSWSVAGRTFTSRLIVGTGKYKDFEQNAAAVEASGAEIVTVAVRRVNVSDPTAPMLTDFIDPKKITYLPNTAGCFNADDAIRTLRLAREALAAGGVAPIVFNAANEVAALAFLDRRLGFLNIAAVVADTLERATNAGMDSGSDDACDAALAVDAAARRIANDIIASLAIAA